MLARTLISIALLAATPALAQTTDPVPRIDVDTSPRPANVSAISCQGPGCRPGRPEAKIRNMSEYIEAVVDPGRGVYIQGYTGQWYYARVRNCPRLGRSARLRFEPSPGGDFDRHSMLRADGWRCFVDSVVEVESLPRRQS
jgi:hypothetical protein